MKIVLAVLLLVLIPPVNCNKEEEIVKPKIFFHEESKNYPYNEDDKIIDSIDLKIQVSNLRNALKEALTEREQTVVIARYGLDGSEPKPQREIARALGISRSYVSRIEKKALDKLKEYLKDYIHEI